MFYFKGQGEAACFISEPQGLLYSFVLPATLLLLFNVFALGHTVIHIAKTRKVVRPLILKVLPTSISNHQTKGCCPSHVDYLADWLANKILH